MTRAGPDAGVEEEVDEEEEDEDEDEDDEDGIMTAVSATRRRRAAS
jgi:hypothetical protein